MDDDSWDKVINMNLRSTFIVTREVCNRAMIPQHYGKIINLSSMKSVLGTALTAYDEKLGKSLLDALLTPTRIYVQSVLPLLTQVNVRSICHITGGGFYENIPRALAAGCVAKLEKKSLRMPPIFPLLQKVGKIPERDMFNTFNMGVGMAVVVPGDRADESVRILKEAGEDAYILGEIAKGAEKGVELC